MCTIQNIQLHLLVKDRTYLQAARLLQRYDMPQGTPAGFNVQFPVQHGPFLELDNTSNASTVQAEGGALHQSRKSGKVLYVFALQSSYMEITFKLILKPGNTKEVCYPGVAVKGTRIGIHECV